MALEGSVTQLASTMRRHLEGNGWTFTFRREPQRYVCTGRLGPLVFEGFAVGGKQYALLQVLAQIQDALSMEEE